MAKKSNFPQHILDMYDALIQTVNGIERKGATMPYTSINGHMFSFLDKDGRLCLRLPEKERNDFIEKYDTALCEQHGTVLKEYVQVPEQLFENINALKDYFALSLEHIKQLKPKPTKK